VTRSTARIAAAVVIAVPLLAYPLVVGSDGARFPSPEDCVRIAPPGETAPLDLVFGRRDTPAEAEELLERVRGIGYADAEMRDDGCGRWKVFYEGIEFYAQGASSAAQARAAGLEAWLELEPPGGS
jgi:hypothetical protein